VQQAQHLAKSVAEVVAEAFQQLINFIVA